MVDFRDWQTDHLILIIGMNPLPNLVAARLLAPPGTRLHLVVTDEVIRLGIPKRLLKLLGRDPSDESCNIPVSSSDPDDIYARILERVHRLDGSIGLHYTGGKKSMATHAYRAVEHELSGSGRSGVFSYLDADTLQLSLRKNGHEGQCFFVRDLVQVSIKEILELHGRSIQSMETSTVNPEFCEQLVKFCQDDQRRRQWRIWAACSLRINSRELNETQARSVHVPGDFPIIGGQTLGSIASSWGMKAKTLADWLHGKWLDEYVYTQACKAAALTGIHETVYSLKPYGLINFEVDVVAMQGYRLFAISATTEDEKGLAKLKLFEALTRSHQMGGDEARTALVTFSVHPVRLARQVNELLTFTDGSTAELAKIRVFGIADLPGLSKLLEHWFKEV